MFKDNEWSVIEEQVTNALETYTLEEILEDAELTVEEALTHLVMNGIIKLPEVRNIGYGTRR